MIFVIATLETTDENRAGLIEAARICVAATRTEPGNISYDFHQSVTDPNTFVFVERWKSRQDLDAHFGMPHLTTWREIAGTLTVGKTVEIIAPETLETL